MDRTADSPTPAGMSKPAPGSPAATPAPVPADSTAPSPVALAASPGMDDARWEPGMPVLDRQAVREPAGGTTLPPSLQGLPPRSVPEMRPTPLQKHYVLMMVPVLIAGAVAITALELGVPASSPLVKLCVLVGAPLLVVTTLDATLRIWRSAWAWMPVDRVKGLFRLAWVAATVTVLGIGVAFAAWVLTA